MPLKQEKSLAKRRSKGEQTRHQILNATIEVLAKQGIKGTTHRSIANQADLQLSLTTYYFKDIQELVHEAFLLSSSRTISQAGAAWLQTFDLLDSFTKTQLKKVSVRQELATVLTRMATEYLVGKIQQFSTDLAVDKLMFTEIQIAPPLRTLANSHRQSLLQPFERLCSYFNPENPQVDADILLTVFTQLEYRHLIDTENIDTTYIHDVLERMIMWILNIKKKTQ